MSPIVKRKTIQEIPSTFGKMETEVQVYVRPDKLTPTDKRNIVPADQLPDAQVQDLAHRFPREYGEELRRRKLPAFDTEAEGGFEDAELGDEEEELEGLAEWQLKFTAQKANDAIGQVQQTEEVGILEGFAEAEQEREGGPRKTVLEAIAARIEEIEQGPTE